MGVVFKMASKTRHYPIVEEQVIRNKKASLLAAKYRSPVTFLNDASLVNHRYHFLRSNTTPIEIPPSRGSLSTHSPLYTSHSFVHVSHTSYLISHAHTTPDLAYISR